MNKKCVNHQLTNIIEKKMIMFNKYNDHIFILNTTFFFFQKPNLKSKPAG